MASSFAGFVYLASSVAIKHRESVVSVSALMVCWGGRGWTEVRENTSQQQIGSDTHVCANKHPLTQTVRNMLKLPDTHLLSCSLTPTQTSRPSQDCVRGVCHCVVRRLGLVLRGVWPLLPQPLQCVCIAYLSQGPGQKGSQLLFAMLIDWIMKRAPSTEATNIQ